MRSYERIMKAVGESPWLIRPETLEVILGILNFRAGGGKLSEEEIRARIGSEVRRADATVTGSVAVLPIYGPIFPKAGLMTEISGATSLERFRGQLRGALSDDGVATIVLDVNSPGGMADMVPETGEEIRRARGTKPIIAVANTEAGSAAYWLASQADELVVTPSGQVGSVGAYMAHEDWSKFDEAMGVKTTLVSAGRFKVERNPFEPLSDDARAYMQEHIDELYSGFVAAVARGRGTSVEDVLENFGKGRMVDAKPAIAAGMADRIGTLEDTVRALGGSVKSVPLIREDPPEVPEDVVPEIPEAAQAKPVRSDAFVRSLPVEDIEVRSEGGGRVIDAYAAVFGVPTRVTDWYYVKDNPFDDEFGTYVETLRSRVFEKSLRDRGTDFQVMFNHGRDIFGRPLERFAMPIAVPLEVRADGHGLRTRSRLAKTELADEVLELIGEGAIRTMSFSGRVIQTNLKRGTAGEPDTLERVEIALREFGPAIFPVYNDAKIVGVRAEAYAHQLAYLPADERARLASILQGTPLEAADQGTRGEPSALDTSAGAEDHSPRAAGPSSQLVRLREQQRRRIAGI